MKFSFFVSRFACISTVCSFFSSSFVSANKIDKIKDFLYSAVDFAYICSLLEAKKEHRKVLEIKNDIYFSIFDGMIQQAKGIDELFAIVLLLPNKITFKEKETNKKYLQYLKKKRVLKVVRNMLPLEDFLKFLNNINKSDTEGDLGTIFDGEKDVFDLKNQNLLELSKFAYSKIFTSIEDIVNRFILNDALEFLLFLEKNKENKPENLKEINSLETKIINLRKNMSDVKSKYLKFDPKRGTSDFISDFWTLSKKIVDTTLDIANYSYKVENYLKKCFEKANKNKLEQYEEYRSALLGFLIEFPYLSTNKNFCMKCQILENLVNEAAEFGIYWKKFPTALDSIQFCSQLVENINKSEKDCQEFKDFINKMKEYSKKNEFSNKAEKMVV